MSAASAGETGHSGTQRVASVTESRPYENLHLGFGQEQTLLGRDGQYPVTRRASSRFQHRRQTAQEQAPQGSPPGGRSICLSAPNIQLSDLESSPAPAPPVRSLGPEARPHPKLQQVTWGNCPQSRWSSPPLGPETPTFGLTAPAA